MELIKLIPDNEKNMIEYMRQEYACYDANTSNYAPLNDVLQPWEENKQDLANLFDGKLILQKSVSIRKSASQLESDIYEVLHKWGSNQKKFDAAFRQTFDAWRYDDNREKSALGWKVFELMSNDSLATNLWNGESFIICNPKDADHPIKINRGCKISKVIGKIAEAYSIPYFEDWRIAHSQALNQKIVRGDLFISIHPLDFMTSSFNGCGWSSCMNWDGGEYRMGTVEMMNSPYVVCAYLSSANPMSLGYYPHNEDQSWNSKKWRQYFIVSPKCIYAIKGYPYWNRDLEATTLKWLKELAESHNFGTYTENLVEYRTTTDTYCEELDRNFHLEFDTNYMYNDFYSGNKYYGYISTTWTDLNIYVMYSGPTECMCCGETRENFGESSDLVCDSCLDRVYCYNCGDSIPNGDVYEVDGEYFCEYCYNDLPVCPFCGEVHIDNNMNRIYLLPAKLDPETDAYTYIYNNRHILLAANICYDCMHYDLHAETAVNKIHSWNQFHYIVFDEDMDDSTIRAITDEECLDAEDVIEYYTKWHLL